MSNNEAIENERAKAGFFFTESIYPGVAMIQDLKNILISTHSNFQKVEVIDTVSHGKILVTDAKTQSAQVDEFIYHESLVHPPLLLSSRLATSQSLSLTANSTNGPKTVFIGGGGELATAREALKYNSIERVVMVDLDETVLEVCKKYLPEWGGEKVTSDPRLDLIIGDAFEYLMNSTETFDCIIMDISDPIEAGPGIMLYTQEFYTHAKKLLSPSGVFVTQAGVANPIHVEGVKIGSDMDTTCYGPITNTLQSVFDHVLPYSVNIPSFGSDWGFVIAFNSSKSSDIEVEDYSLLSHHEIDDMISKYITYKESDGDISQPDSLKYYDGICHRRMFSLAKSLRMAMKKDTRIMTKDNPVFMF